MGLPRGSELVLLALSLACSSCTCSGNSGSSASSSARPSEDQDRADVLADDQELADELTEAGSNAEARAWLAVPSNAFVNETNADVHAIVEGFYEAGASRVLVDGITPLAGHPTSASIVVVLPTDPAARTRVFAHAREITPRIGDDTPPDYGQRYLSYAFE